MTNTLRTIRSKHLEDLYLAMLESIGGLEETLWVVPAGSEAEQYISFFVELLTMHLKAINKVEQAIDKIEQAIKEAEEVL